MIPATVALATLALATASRAAPPSPPEKTVRSQRELARLVRTHCGDCHGREDAEAGVRLVALAERSDSFVTHFRTWLKAAELVRDGQMPPADADRLAKPVRERLESAIRRGIAEAARRRNGHPSRVVMRRLTSAEYGYTINDLTGLQLDLDRGFVSDAVGGSGFTNTGIVQFVQETTLERYLEAARRVAEHAVIGAGPLQFHQDPGQTGFELSAIARIQQIYRRHGFRTAAGEGGEPFGLDKYPRGFLAAWKLQALRPAQRQAAAQRIAADEKIDARWIHYLVGVLSQRSPSFPLSDIVTRWQALPARVPGDERQEQQVRKRCREIAARMHRWQNRFGANADAKEEAPVLRKDLFHVTRQQPFVMNVNWPEGTRAAHLQFTVESAVQKGKPDAVILWRDPRIQFRIADQQLRDHQPLGPFLDEASRRRLRFGKHPQRARIAAGDFVTRGANVTSIVLPIPKGSRSAQLKVTAELDTQHGEDCIVRLTIAQREETDQGKSVSGLVADPQSKAFAAWKEGVLAFAEQLPQVSQREPAPSDRDPIPELFDQTYNNPERNAYHTRIKYHRDDRFLVEHILDDATRKELDIAWADLLGSFEFHDAWLQFVVKKFQLSKSLTQVSELRPAEIAALPAEPQRYVRRLRREYDSIQRAFVQAEPGHFRDVLDLAARAWRRPLSDQEKRRLRAFYSELRSTRGQAHQKTHQQALRGVIARILVSPAFLYRSERAQPNRVTRLTDAELASRLSYFLWSSAPDATLRQAVAEGDLHNPKTLRQQARRMLRDARSERLAKEFFGQWFGFYRFDRYRGIDPQRFPEFTDSLKASLYEEAVRFFAHIVRRDRPLEEILFADYTFLNQELADHYRIRSATPLAAQHRKVEGAQRMHRGGLLRLGAVLAVTSAPLRTSPVKRGDWVLRRVLGTAVPPPPADAGSIPGDDVTGDGLTVRQRLEAHRRKASCKNCHSRIDPLGFALESFDPLGRHRQRYRDGKPIQTTGVLRDGARITDVASLHAYLKRMRPRFDRTLCDKLLGYALGRRTEVGDLPLREQMQQDLARGGRMSDLVLRIVTSRQFRYHGVASDTDTSSSPSPP